MSVVPAPVAAVRRLTLSPREIDRLLDVGHDGAQEAADVEVTP